MTHGNVANLVCTSPGDLGICQGVRVGQVLNISFDMGMSIFLLTSNHCYSLKTVLTALLAAWEILGSLCNGGTLVLRGSNWEETLQEVGNHTQQLPPLVTETLTSSLLD